MLVQEIFSAFMAMDNLDLSNDEILKNCYNLKNTTEGRIISNKGGWQSEDIVKNKSFENFFEKVTEKANSIKDLYKLKNEHMLFVDSAWVNINQKYDYNVLHNHGDNFFSGVYYANVPDNSGAIEFRHPSAAKAVISWSKFAYQLNGMNSDILNIEPKTGQIIIFPSWLDHEVNRNNSDEERVSIAFNFKIK